MTPRVLPTHRHAERPSGQEAHSSGNLARRARGVAWIGLGLGMALYALSRKAKEPAGHAPAQDAPREVHARSAITINAPADDVYRLWEGFQGLPRFMRDVATVEIADVRQSRWTLAVPGGLTVTWDVEITEARPNELIAWQTAAGSRLAARGEVRFRPAPGDRGTEVVFDAAFTPPGGEAGRTIATLIADVLGTKLGNDLRRAKQLIELGEIVQSDDSVIPGPNPAQPVARRAA